MPTLQDLIVNTIIVDNQTTDILSTGQILSIYKTIKVGCGLRRYAAHIFAWKVVTSPNMVVESVLDLLKQDADLCADFLGLVRECQVNPIQDPRKLERCRFHQHGRNKACYLL